MTPAQKSRLIGFNASIKNRGVVLSLASNGAKLAQPAPLCCLLEPKSENHRRKYETVTDELVTDLVHAKRSEVQSLESNLGKLIQPGAIFTRTDSTATYRVHKRVDESSNVAAIMFHCIAMTPDP